MKGNSAVHSDAYLIFRIFADKIETIKEPVKKKAKTGKDELKAAR